MTTPPRPTPAVGTTVTLRVRTPVGPIGVVGVLVAATPQQWSVRRRDGTVADLDVTAIEAARIVPPSAAQRASAAEVEQAAALGWRALEAARLGEWLLRASEGFTDRANSALAVGDPGMPLPSAVDAVREWYAGRGLPPRIAVPTGAAPDGLVEALAERGWTAGPPTHVMTAEITHLVRAVPELDVASTRVPLRPDPAAGVRPHLDDAPDEAWLASYRVAGGRLPPAARAVLTNHAIAVFASLRTEAGEVAAIARAAVDGRWAGLAAVEVAPAWRRQGLGRLVSAAALREAARRGARRTYLQVRADNAPAIAMYQRLNATIHHDYAYWTAPAPTPTRL